MKEKIYDAQTGMEYVLVGDYYLPALKLPRTRPIGHWGMLHKAYLKLRKSAYYQSFQPVKKDTDHLQTVMSTVEEAGDVMHLSQNVVETFIDRIEVFNDERVKIRFTFEDVLADYAE